MRHRAIRVNGHVVNVPSCVVRVGDQLEPCAGERIGRDPREMKKSLSKAGGLEALKNQMVREKTLDFLTSVANIHPEG